MPHVFWLHSFRTLPEGLQIQWHSKQTFARHVQFGSWCLSFCSKLSKLSRVQSGASKLSDAPGTGVWGRNPHGLEGLGGRGVEAGAGAGPGPGRDAAADAAAADAEAQPKPDRGQGRPGGRGRGSLRGRGGNDTTPKSGVKRN